MMDPVNNGRYFQCRDLRVVVDPLGRLPRALSLVEALEAYTELHEAIEQLKAKIDIGKVFTEPSERDVVSDETRQQLHAPGDWCVTVPSMLPGCPLVTVGFDANKRTGYIEVPTGVDASTKRVPSYYLRVRCPMEADRLRAMVTVVAGWPIQ